MNCSADARPGPVALAGRVGGPVGVGTAVGVPLTVVPGGVDAPLDTADELGGGAVLGWPASGLADVQAVRSVVAARQARRWIVGLLRLVTSVSPP